MTSRQNLHSLGMGYLAMKSHVFLQTQIPDQRFQIRPVPTVPDDVQLDLLLPYQRRGALYDDIAVLVRDEPAEETDLNGRHIVVPAIFNDILLGYAIFVDEEQPARLHATTGCQEV